MKNNYHTHLRDSTPNQPSVGSVPLDFRFRYFIRCIHLHITKKNYFQNECIEQYTGIGNPISCRFGMESFIFNFIRVTYSFKCY